MNQVYSSQNITYFANIFTLIFTDYEINVANTVNIPQILLNKYAECEQFSILFL